MSEDRMLEDLLARPETWAEPPADVETRVLAEITASQQETPETPARRWTWQIVAGLATVAASIVLAVFFGLGAGEEPEAAVFALSPTIEAPDLVGTASVGAVDAGWWVRLELTGLPPAPEGSYYEGWVSNSSNTVSIGTFHMKGGTSVALWSGVDLTEYNDLWVTLQHEGGGHDPTDLVMLTGRFEGLE